MDERSSRGTGRARHRARVVAAAVIVLAATQLGGCICRDDRQPGDPTRDQVRLVRGNIAAAQEALYMQPEPDCRRARIAVTIAATEHATWQKPYYENWANRIAGMRDEVKRRCSATGSSTTTTPAAPSAATPDPTGTSTPSTPAGTSTAPAPTPTSKTPPPVTPTSAQEVPPAEPEPGPSDEVPSG
jgi:hypothetical protein